LSDKTSKKLPQIQSSLKPIQATTTKECGLQVAHTQDTSQFVPYILQEYPTNYRTLSSPKITYTEHAKITHFCLFSFFPPFVSCYMHVRDISKPFFGKTA
jgi:hypothetical protein